MDDLQESDFNLPLEEFLKLIKGNDVNKLQFDGLHLIFELIANERFDIIERLKNLNVNVINLSQETPLHRCCYDHKINIIKLLLDRGAKIESTDDVKNTPLHISCYLENIEITTLLLSKGANVNALDGYGSSPLHLSHRNIEIVELLLSYGADINSIDNEKRSPLHQACLFKHMEMIEFYLQKGAKVYYKNEEPNIFRGCTFTPEEREEVLKLIEFYRGINIKGSRK